MPKGAKKRKAAKRKKEQEASSNSNNNNDGRDDNNSTSINSNTPQGYDPKSQDERDSDGGDVSSPVAQDHQEHRHSFDKGNEEPNKTVPSSIKSAVPDSNAGVTENGEGSKKVEPGDSEWDTDNKSIRIAHVDSSKESSSSSSSSSSDEESEAVEKKRKEEAPNEVETKAVDSSSERMTQFSENGKSLEDSNKNPVLGTVPDVVGDAHVVPMSEVVKHVVESSQVENPEVLDVVESGMKEDEVQLLPAANESTDISTTVEAPRKDEDKVLSILDNKSSNVVGSTHENDDKIFTSSVAHPAEAANDAENIKYSDTSGCTENQPLVASGPRVSQRTSWMNCCGLFDVLTGSGR